MARQRSFQLLVSVFASVFVWSGCTYTSDAFGPIVCQTEGERDGDRECRGGIWVTLDEIMPMEMGVDADMDMGIDVMEMNPPVDMSDMDEPVDMPPVDMCEPETQAELCENRCQTFTVLNSCGASQAIDCGECGDGAPCDSETNTCLDCDPFDREAYCTENGFDCGVHDPPEGSCQTETFTCGDFNGNCQGTDTCNPDTRACDPCEPESDAEVCLGLELFCIQPLVPTSDTCTGQGRMVDCSGCPYTSTEDSNVGVGTGPFINPAPSPGASPGSNPTDIVYWLNPEVGLDEMGQVWTNQAVGTPPAAATLQGTVSRTPIADRVNSYSMVQLGEDGFIDLPLQGDVGDFTFAVVFRSQFATATATTEPWQEQPTLLGCSNDAATDAAFGLAMLQSGELIYAPTPADDEIAFTSATPVNGGDLHVLLVLRDQSADNVSLILDGELIADDVSALGGDITGTGALRLGAQVETMTGMLLRGEWEGDLGDVLYFSRIVQPTIKDTLSTVLALKYGITFDTPTEYLFTPNRIAYDATVEDGYDAHIAALIRSDGAGLHQTRARSSEADSVLTITHGLFLEQATPIDQNDVSIAIASNGQPAQGSGAIFDIDGTYEVASVPRRWRLDGTNISTHTFTLSFEISGMPGVDTLILSDTPDFTGTLEYYPVRAIDDDPADAIPPASRAIELTLDRTAEGSANPRKYFTFGELGVK